MRFMPDIFLKYLKMLSENVVAKRRKYSGVIALVSSTRSESAEYAAIISINAQNVFDD